VIKVGKLKFNRKSLKYGSSSLILIVIVVAIAIFINLLVGMGDLKLDLTSNKIYSLSNESKTILKGIKKDVTIYGLFDDAKYPGGSEYKELINLLSEYQQFGIKVTYVDPDKDPGTINALDKDHTKDIAKGDFVVKSGNKVKKLGAGQLYGEDTQYGRMYKAEPLITGAIKFVTADFTPVAYFVEGQNEYSITNDMPQVRAELENNNFEVKSLTLMSEDKIPADCKLLVFASPKKDLSESERIKVDEYLKNNGRAIFMFDPVETGDRFVNFEEILATFNIGINYDRVKETDDSKHLSGDEYSIAAALQPNDINTPFLNYFGEDPVFVPDSRSLSILNNAKEWLVTTSLIKTSDKSVSSSLVNQGATEQGPFDLAIASEITGSSKVLVFGNGKFMLDAALKSQYAASFSYVKTYFVSTVVNWIQDKSDETTISPKIISPKALTTTAGQAKSISIILIGVLPILIMCCGLVVWSRRRHL
jgi:ABC-2 type transport system permease protein